MQEVIKFELKGLNATIHKPDSNMTYFTYNNPHKVMLLGLLGAIIGENGYNYNCLFKDKANKLPEFYTQLEDIKIGVKPNSKKGIFTKKIHQFNNSVGYANINDSVPSNLIVTEQWLENPSWTIYILSNNTNRYLKLKDYLTNNKCEYIPYIGKNDNFADISNVRVAQSKNIETADKIDSIFTDINYEVCNIFDDFVSFGFSNEQQNNNEQDEEFISNEVMPTKLNENIGYTDFKEFVYTNKKIKIKNNCENIYEVDGENIYFF